MKDLIGRCRDACGDFGVARMGTWLLVSLLTLVAIWIVAPQQVAVILAKFNLLALGAWLGYWVDRMAFPYSRPHEAKAAQAEAAQIRRALIIAAAMVSMALAL